MYVTICLFGPDYWVPISADHHLNGSRILHVKVMTWSVAWRILSRHVNPCIGTKINTLRAAARNIASQFPRAVRALKFNTYGESLVVKNGREKTFFVPTFSGFLFFLLLFPGEIQGKVDTAREPNLSSQF